MELCEELKNCLLEADDVVLERGLEFTSPELVVYCLSDYGTVRLLAANPEVNLGQFEKDLLAYLESYFPEKQRKYKKNEGAEHSVSYDDVLKDAARIAKEDGAEKISVCHYLYSIIENKNEVIVESNENINL